MWVRVRVRVLLTCCSCAHSPYIHSRNIKTPCRKMVDSKWYKRHIGAECCSLLSETICIQSPSERIYSESLCCAEQVADCSTLWLRRMHNFIRSRMQCRSTKIEAGDAPGTKTGPKYSTIIYIQRLFLYSSCTVIELHAMPKLDVIFSVVWFLWA